MINIKKLHLVHKYYPNVPRRFGKTTYCYDSLLRASQTEQYKNLCYITNTSCYARESLRDFIEFLDKEGEKYDVISINSVIVNNTEIVFKSRKEQQYFRFDGYIEDYF
jgi:retron-type reverse transcriptase